MSVERDLLEQAAASIDDDWCERWKKDLLKDIDSYLAKPEKQPLATFTVQDGKVIRYSLKWGELTNGDYEIYAKD